MTRAECSVDRSNLAMATVDFVLDTEVHSLMRSPCGNFDVQLLSTIWNLQSSTDARDLVDMETSYLA